VKRCTTSRQLGSIIEIIHNGIIATRFTADNINFRREAYTAWDRPVGTIQGV
jgi:hypothetical protein